ncbi:LamG-like jellyroll fold domain-containing protein [Roseibacillus ishigakijimensis]|uniref:PEP-CTERM sorting domain-containing protein n=1 Tax=Roseibacillus ishigakijimensis TaxID=454146 RepID=A0A934RJN8_9BACT|nr:LamG-like jellyroll fold domain-containing protein [Roseibacillus ishigakijimensis]MBK1832912.1 PEP-CTERM sorting domain-containing protein [Roseibacillus ishigakijimensis]
MKKRTLILSLACAASSQAALVAHYTFDESSGQTAADSAGTPQNLTTTNGTVAWTTGQMGGAIDLTADVMVANDAIGNGNNFTISIWVNEASGQTGYRGIFTTGADFVDNTSGDPIVPGGGEDNWGINVEGTRQADMRYNNPTVGSSHGVDVPAFEQNVWQHLVMTFAGDGVSSTGGVYLNGNLIATITQPTFNDLSYNAGGQIWQLGTDRNNDSRRFTGLVDDLAIWDEALSDEQITALYNGGLAGLNAAEVIPEPSSALLVLSGGLLALRRRR